MALRPAGLTKILHELESLPQPDGPAQIVGEALSDHAAHNRPSHQESRTAAGGRRAGGRRAG